MASSSHFVGMIKGKHAICRDHPSGPGMNWGFDKNYTSCACVHLFTLK